MEKQKLTFVNGRYFVGDENGVEVVKDVFMNLLKGEQFSGNTGFGSLMAQQQSYYSLLYREQKDMKLLNDMIEKGLPVESYVYLIRQKLNELTKELQEYNRESVERVLMKNIVDKISTK
jgi:hypothetical protein